MLLYLMTFEYAKFANLSSLSCSKIDAASNEDETNEPQFIKVARAWRET